MQETGQLARDVGGSLDEMTAAMTGLTWQRLVFALRGGAGLGALPKRSAS
jgi:hypothetical protein